jgi:osmotically inducible protein OsmC
MGATRRADAVWQGDLLSGSGTIERVQSGAFGGLPVTWASRTEQPEGRTSPEELIAAAHAACYAMAFSNVLATGGNAPERLSVSATCHFDPIEGGGFAVSRMDLEVRGRVPGMDDAAFREAADEGERSCPVSNALRGNVDINLTAALDG